MKIPLRDARPFLVSSTDTLRQAMQRIEAGGLGLVLIVDSSGQLAGTLSDGDVRRALLRGADLDSPALGVANERPVSAVMDRCSVDQLLMLFRQHGVRQIPLLDEMRRPVSLSVLTDFAPSARDNPVVIMAGGRGSRLGPLTTEQPKPLVHVGGRPILETLVRQVVASGFYRIMLAVNYHADQIIEHFGDGARFGVAIEYLREREPLGTAGALALARDRLDVPFLVINADLLTSARFDEILDHHLERNNDLTLTTAEVEVELRYGIVETAEDDRVSAIREKPKVHVSANAGIYVLRPTALAHVPPGPSNMPDVVTALLAAGGRVGCYRLGSLWLDIGELSDLHRASTLFDQIPT